ncbi:hypothetical protein KIN20_032405 [Parelaphostrongylus tenuis]|uniref:Uncharacterized protein n=1 Tax=Parelaphostrongylus tenuis TaxID=148309 RepID=A0AAD5R6J7_PARTN|nr:hypothetical protein KIN20_032405 [Parelaphostrongylus tenuis]
MNCGDIRLHLVHFSVNKGVDECLQSESYDIEYIHFIVNFAIEFIQNTVDDFINNHRHLCSLEHLRPRHPSCSPSVNVHRNVLDFEKVLIEIGQQTGYHVCFLYANSIVTLPAFFERNTVVVHLPELNGLHYKEVLSSGSHNQLISLGFAVGEALHEIGHLFGAFHSTCGIMSRQQNAAGLLGVSCADMEVESRNCFFDNYSICLFAHSPFFNHVIQSPQLSPVLFKFSNGEIHLKCRSGILLVVIIQGTKYRDVKVYEALLSVTVRVDEQSWDLIQVYNGFYEVKNIIK